MALRKKFVLIFLIQNVSELYGLINRDLKGLWVLNDQQGDYVNLKAHVPGGIYTDLEKNQIINDVFYGNNDVETRWVSKRNWTYSRTFIMDQDNLLHKNINIVFDGVDTFATILINNETVGFTDNMFVRYVFDIKSKLYLGVNNVTVMFESPVEKAKKLYEEQSKSYEVKPSCVPDYYSGECHANHVRKMQASFSWDWGPAFPSVGIWKKVYVEAFNSSVIRDVTVKTIPNDSTDSWDIHLKTYFAPVESNIKGALSVTLHTDVGSVSNIYDIEITKDDTDEFVEYRNFSIPKLQVKLWWPNGYGNSTLYKLEVLFTSDNKIEQDSRDINIGFRTIQLNQDQYDTGRAFYFIINDIPIFAKGSNIIPIDILPERGQNSTTIRFLLQSAKDVHMNMLRVWGGGVYESDEFYDVADELGILIWQDFMFACSMYPTNADYLKTVKQEVTHQVRRLQHHASVAIWAANNENEAALRQNWYGTNANFTLYKEDFIKLYVDTIKPTVFESDDSRDFLTSSPTNGVESEEEDYIALNPQDPFFGDVHYYNYILDSWNSNIYPTPRFASEYGYQSLPSLKTLLTITDNITNLLIDGELMTNRQHHELGYFEMHLLTQYRLKLPLVMDSMKYLKTMIFYGQIMQAMAIKIETEHYRRWKGNLEGVLGNTMGALYWQLNDVWVAPTWAGIDYKQNWKMLHYFAREFFAPVIITSDLTPNRELGIFIINDKITSLRNLTANIRVYKWNNMVSVHSENISVTEVSEKAVQVSSIWIDPYLVDVGCGNLSTAKSNCFIYLSVFDSNGQTVTPNNFVFPTELKNVDLKQPNVTVASITNVDKGLNFKITLKTDTTALFVWLDSKEIKGRFSENGFLQVTELKDVYFNAELPTDVPSITEVLSVTNLMDKEYI